MFRFIPVLLSTTQKFPVSNLTIHHNHTIQIFDTPCVNHMGYPLILSHVLSTKIV